MGTRLRVRMLPTLLIVIAIHQASWPLGLFLASKVLISLEFSTASTL